MMDIYEAFSCHTLLPVKIDDVLDCVQNVVADSTIVFYKDTSLAKRGCWSYLHSYDDFGGLYEGTRRIHRIVYSYELSETERRLAICKELLHILDQNGNKASTEQGVLSLIDQICIPANAGITMPGFTDQTGALRALAILLPRDALETLTEAHKDGKITIGEIAIAADIPIGYARIAVTDLWLNLVDTIK